MLQIDFAKVICPNCQRTISHYLGGTDSIYRTNCPRCKSIVVIYSAGKTALLTNEVMARIKIEINF